MCALTFCPLRARAASPPRRLVVQGVLLVADGISLLFDYPRGNRLVCVGVLVKRTYFEGCCLGSVHGYWVSVAVGEGCPG